MRVVIAGGHGKIALRLERLLAGRGDQVVGVVRNPDHVADVRATGAAAEVLDLESASVEQLAGVLSGADAVVFAAGAGPGSTAGRKDTVDRGAAVLLADAAVTAGVPRYLLVSSVGVDDQPDHSRGEVWVAYQRAKKAAEVDVAARSLRTVLLRPGALTDDAGAGTVALGPPGQDRTPVTRDDVAAVIAALLSSDRAWTAGDPVVLELVGGDTPIDTAVAVATGETAGTVDAVREGQK